MGETVQPMTSREAIDRGRKDWNEEHETYAIREDLFRQNVFAPYAGIKMTAWHGPSGVEDGFAIVKRPTEAIDDYADERTAWIALLVGADQSSPSGMIEALLGQLRADGVETVHFGAGPQHFFPGVATGMDGLLRDGLLESGFEVEGSVVDLTRTLTEYRTPPDVDATQSDWDVELHRGTTREGDLHSLLEETFPTRWDYEVSNLARLPGGLERYWLLYAENDPVGFVRATTSDSTVQAPNRTFADRFRESVLGVGPLGIAPEYRGRGWGLAMIDAVLTHYRDRGVERAVIDWTDLEGYYEQLGFERFETYEYARRSLV